MKIIWALFDDGNQSVKTTMEPLGYKVYSFGIQKKETVEYLDMTQPFENIKETLDKYPKPDFIVASPMCNAFSRQAVRGGFDTNGNATFSKINGNLQMRKPEEYALHRSRVKSQQWTYYDKQLPKALLGLKAALNTAMIIKHYDAPKWYIENPRLSYIWDFITKQQQAAPITGIKNIADYCMYGYPSKKQTCFLSNVEIMFPKCNHKTHSNFRNIRVKDGKSMKDIRSAIPAGIIENIFKHFEEKV